MPILELVSPQRLLILPPPTSLCLSILPQKKTRTPHRIRTLNRMLGNHNDRPLHLQIQLLLQRNLRQLLDSLLSQTLLQNWPLSNWAHLSSLSLFF